MVVVVVGLLAACPAPVSDDRATFPLGRAAGLAPNDAGLSLQPLSGFDDAGIPPAQTGLYDSRVFDFGAPFAVRSVHLSTVRPAGRPLPTSGGRDQGFAAGGVDMVGNALLFPFDDAAGSATVADRSGSGHVGVHDGGLAFGRTGVAGTAMTNDSGCVFVPSAPSLHPGNQLTIAAWIRPTGLDGVEPHGIVAKRADFLVQSEYAFFIWQGDRLWVDLDSENDRFGGNAVIRNDRWTHVAMVYDGRLDAGVRARLFVDGRLDVMAPESSATLTPQNVPVAVGCLPNPGGGILQPFNGELDEVAVWHRAFSDLEVQSLYARGASRHELGVRGCADPACALDGPFATVPPGTPLLFAPTRYFQYRLGAAAPPSLLEWSTVTSLAVELSCDAGTAVDGGLDAGSAEPDAGTVDAGGVDAGGSATDAGHQADGGASAHDAGVDVGVVNPGPPRDLEVRFGCSTTPGLLAVLVLVSGWRRRRTGS